MTTEERTGGTAASDAAAAVEATWTRLHARLGDAGLRRSGLAPPASAPALAAAHLPPSLRAMYAAHDGAAGVVELLGIEDAVWGPLADAREDEIDGKKLVVFGAMVDERLAVVLDSEELVAIAPNGGLHVLEKHVGVPLGRVTTALEAGITELDDHGHLVPTETARSVARELSPAADQAELAVIGELATVLIAQHVVELRDGATTADLARALAAAVHRSSPRKRTQALLAVFEDPLVDDIFVDDEELLAFVEGVARQLG